MTKLLLKPLYLVIIGVLILIIVGIFLGVKNVNDQASLKKADEIATPYQTNIDAYKKAADADIRAKSLTVNSEQTAEAFGLAVDAKVKAIPALTSPGEYGEKHSKSYIKAVATRDQFRNAYEELGLYVHGDLVNRYKYLATIQHMLDMKVSDYLGNSQVTDGTPVRQKLIPPYQAAYDAFAKLSVPEGEGTLAKNVRNTFTSFITAAQDAATKLDAKQSFSFDFSKEFADLQSQVTAERTTLQTAFMDKVSRAVK